MTHYPYLIIGGGLTGAAAVRGIRRLDSEGQIGLFTREPHSPYKRPFLSKALWKGVPFEKVWIKMDTSHVDLHLDAPIVRIDRDKHQVIDAQGKVYGYDKLLLATGGETRRLPWEVDGLIYFRGLDDYLQLKSLTEIKSHIAVIGGGFIGSEIAAALSMQDKRVTMIFPEADIGTRIFPASLSRFITDYYRSKGVEVLASHGVEGIARLPDGYEIRSNRGKALHADGVVVGIGLQADAGLASAAKLSVDNGILVDEYLRTDDPAIYAAGDVANFFNPALGKRMRVEHEDNANIMGETAGRNMAGDNAPYHHLPFFYSDLFDLGYEAVGEIDAGMEMVEDWQEPNRKGVVYYLRQGRVRGVLLWNTWGHMEQARALITRPGPFSAEAYIRE